MLALISSLIFVRIMRNGNDKKNYDVKCFMGSFAFYTVTDIVMSFMFGEQFSAAGMIFFMNTMFLIAVKDIKQRVIPNSLVLVLISVRLIISVAAGISGGDMRTELLKAAAGMICGFIITGIAAVLPGKGMGAGDVKMYAAIGSFAGLTGVMDILIYTCLLCSVTGIVIIAVRKCSVKTFLPMAPFAYAGTVIYMITGSAAL